MMTNKLNPKEQDDWNGEVEEKINKLDKTDVKKWLNDIYKNENDFSWPDRFRAKRAWHYLELATLEMYSMQYEDPEKIPLYWRDEQIK